MKPNEHVHDKRFDGDDPYLVCHGCGQRWDALTGLGYRAPQPVTEGLRERIEREIAYLDVEGRFVSGPQVAAQLRVALTGTEPAE